MCRLWLVDSDLQQFNERAADCLRVPCVRKKCGTKIAYRSEIYALKSCCKMAANGTFNSTYNSITIVCLSWPISRAEIIKPHALVETTDVTRNSCAGHSPVQSIGHARIVVDAALRLLVRADMAVTKMQISPVFVNGFENGFHQWIQRIFLVVVDAKKVGFRKIFFKVGSTLRPCSG